jgi:hypothetical protein|eukprot:COSAG02_NODE_11997_length_1617_cov_0.738472_1_plen_207_part_00
MDIHVCVHGWMDTRSFGLARLLPPFAVQLRALPPAPPAQQQEKDGSVASGSTQKAKAKRSRTAAQSKATVRLGLAPGRLVSVTPVDVSWPLSSGVMVISRIVACIQRLELCAQRPSRCTDTGPPNGCAATREASQADDQEGVWSTQQSCEEAWWQRLSKASRLHGLAACQRSNAAFDSGSASGVPLQPPCRSRSPWHTGVLAQRQD